MVFASCQQLTFDAPDAGDKSSVPVRGLRILPRARPNAPRYPSPASYILEASLSPVRRRRLPPDAEVCGGIAHVGAGAQAGVPSSGARGIAIVLLLGFPLPAFTSVAKARNDYRFGRARMNSLFATRRTMRQASTGRASCSAIPRAESAATPAICLLPAVDVRCSRRGRQVVGPPPGCGRRRCARRPPARSAGGRGPLSSPTGAGLWVMTCRDATGPPRAAGYRAIACSSRSARTYGL